jgi:hypothetical protein
MFVRSLLLVSLFAVACSSEQLEPAPGSGGAPDMSAAGAGVGANGGSGGVTDRPDECECGRKNDYTGTLPLACVCGDGNCPTFADKSAPLDVCPEQSSLARGPIERRGCGFIEYESGSFSGGGKSRFDAQTGKLIALSGWSDIGGGQPCGTAAYEAGPFVDCPEFVECLNCLTASGETNGLPLCSDLE